MGTSWSAIRRALQEQRRPRADDQGLDKAAVALILRDGPTGIEILFIRRAEHPLDPWSGQMAFPGGRAEETDGDLKVTAMRETLEEIGLDLKSAEFLGPMDEVRAAARLRPVNLAITPFVFRLLANSELRLSPEVRSVHWLPFEALLSPDATGRFEYDHEGETLVFPCLRFRDVLVWGLTYKMFMNFSSLIVPPTPEASSTLER